jgi:transcription initiation factor TFIIIB Brf1 subunit/transcription initiation factor TFIIB
MIFAASYGKDPNALAVATLYAACLKEGEKVSHLQIAIAGNTSVVTCASILLTITVDAEGHKIIYSN